MSEQGTIVINLNRIEIYMKKGHEDFFFIIGIIKH